MHKCIQYKNLDETFSPYIFTEYAIRLPYVYSYYLSFLKNTLQFS